MGTFRLGIELGNAAMSTPQHVARALQEVARRIDHGGEFIEGNIRDENGNTVGSWDVEDPPEAEHEWEVSLVLDDDSFFDYVTVYAPSREAACEHENVQNRIRSAEAMDGETLTVSEVRQVD